MSQPSIQAYSLVLPQYWVNGTETEVVDDLVEHTSIEFFIVDVQEKIIHIVAIENVAVAAPGNLWCWIELSPVPSTVSNAYWGAIGGGGGAIAPTAPLIIVGTGVDGTTHAEKIAWNMHSTYARIVVQTPVAAGAPGDNWRVQIAFEGKTV